MGLIQAIILHTPMPEETRIKVIKDQYVYPFIHPTSLEELEDRRLFSSRLEVTYTDEDYRHIYLTVDGHWHYNTDANLLDETTPYYAYRIVAHFSRFYALHEYFETHYQLGSGQEHVLTQEDFDNFIKHSEPIYQMATSDHENASASLSLEDYTNVGGFFYDISGYDEWSLHNVCDFYQYLHTLNRSFQKLGEGQFLVYKAWRT